MSYQNHLTPQQLRNFRRRCRFIVCGEPCDVFKDREGDIFLATVNRYEDNSAAWIEATSYTYYEGAQEIGPNYLRECRKADETTARRVISTELAMWSRMPDGTVAGWAPEQIAEEARRIANA